MGTLTVYKASAGTGKTFRLAVDYIKLLISNPQSYKSILAVTFTNKATEEMKTRILSQLYGIWKRLPDSNDYMERIVEELGVSEEHASQQAAKALRELIHNYSYFRVETIDAFFQGVLRNLARELDLTANLRIALNDEQVEEQAVDDLIDSLNNNSQELAWILDYINESIDNDKSWNVIGQIKQFGNNIFKDV
ncbi:MAG: UvrD-helicase domain-containing protein, partial [Prevotella sp.]|nr:UvrD-helicase domain-containing protein [Prevotella sp.]